jgi:STE24 endopeptidase
MNESKASRYQRLRRRAHVAGVASGVACVALLALTPASKSLAGWAAGFTAAFPAHLAGLATTVTFVAAVVVLWEVVALPAVLYVGLSVDRRFKSADHSVEGVLAAQAQATVVALAAAVAGALIVFAAAHLAGAWWWLVAGASLALALVAAVRLGPAFLGRSGAARPVARASLMSALRELARRSDIAVSDILEWRVDGHVHATALVTGLGRTRRVFLASAILRDWSDDEIAVVVAHELAHHVHQDLWATLAVDSVLLSFGLWAGDHAVRWFAPALSLSSAGDVAALPLIALVTGGVWLLATPLRHAQSRAQERRADRFALKMTGGAEAFGAAVRRLSAQHLAEERPSTLTRWLFYRHPPVAERLELAERFRTSSPPRS